MKIKSFLHLKGHSTLYAGIWYTIGAFFIKGITVITVPIFTRLMTTTEYGSYSVYSAYINIFYALIGLSVHLSIKPAKYEFPGEQFPKYLSSSMTLSLISFAIVLVAANICFQPLQAALGFDRLLLNCLILHSYGTFIFYFITNQYNIEMHYKKYVTLAVANGLSTQALPLIIIVTAYSNDRYLGRVFASAVPVIAMGTVALIHTMMKGKCFYQKKYWKFALIISLPLIPNELSHVLLSSFDRVMIENYVDASAAGVYSLVYSIGNLLVMVQSAFISTWVPWLFEKLSQNNYAVIRKYSTVFLLAFSVITVSFVSVSPEIIKLFAPQEYWVGNGMVLPVALSTFCMFLYLFPSYFQYYKKHVIIIGFCTTFAAVLNIALNYISIPNYGYESAAYTTLISYAVMFLLQWFTAQDPIKYKIYDTKAIVFYTVFVFLASCCMSLLENAILIRYGLMLVILFVLFLINRKLLTEIWRGIFGNENPT